MKHLIIILLVVASPFIGFLLADTPAPDAVNTTTQAAQQQPETIFIFKTQDGSATAVHLESPLLHIPTIGEEVVINSGIHRGRVSETRNFIHLDHDQVIAQKIVIHCSPL